MDFNYHSNPLFVIIYFWLYPNFYKIFSTIFKYKRKYLENLRVDAPNILEIDNIQEFEYINELLKSSVLKKYNLCLPQRKL